MRCYSWSSLCLVVIVSTVLFDVCMQEGITVENLFRFPYGSNSMGVSKNIEFLNEKQQNVFDEIHRCC